MKLQEGFELSSKRIQWTLGMALVGMLLTTKRPDPPVFSRLAIAACWAGALGLGIGTLVDKENPTQHPGFYWSLALTPVFALIGFLVGPDDIDWTLRRMCFTAGGALVGALLGCIVGSFHRRGIGAKNIRST
jgi:drug/metabolite transporter (DMT)-like permease